MERSAAEADVIPSAANAAPASRSFFIAHLTFRNNLERTQMRRTPMVLKRCLINSIPSRSRDELALLQNRHERITAICITVNLCEMIVSRFISRDESLKRKTPEHAL